MHGKRHQVFHQGRGLFKGLPSPFGAARYHSLMAEPNSPELEVTAWTEDGVIMGLQHRAFPLHGVQFHPESFLTSHGHALAANFLAERIVGGGGQGPKVPLQPSPKPLPNPLKGVKGGMLTGSRIAQLAQAKACGFQRKIGLPQGSSR